MKNNFKWLLWVTLTFVACNNDESLTAENPATSGTFMPGEGGETTGVATTGTDKGFSEVSGGGSQVRNVIVNMTNSFNIKAATMKESMKEVEAIAIETVVRIAQGAELTLAN